MPTYVYECPECGRQIELMHKISETSHVSCALPGCVDKNVEMKRIIQPSTFVLKGSCWSRDGYSGGNK